MASGWTLVANEVNAGDDNDAAVRVLWVSTAFYPEIAMGGNVTQAWEECRALARRGASVTVVTTRFGRSADAAHSYEGIEVRYHANTFGYVRSFSAALAIAAFRSASRADVIHLNSPWQLANPFAALGARGSRRPYVVSLRGTFMPWALAYHGWRKRPYYGVVESRVLAGAAALIASNPREADIARRRWPDTQVETLPGIVDVERMRTRPHGDLRARFGIPAQNPLVLFVGRNHPVKGLDLLIEAFRDVAARIPDAHLMVAGPDERGTSGDLVAAIRSAGIGDRVTLAGLLSEDDKVLAYHQADLVVMPSRQEGFGQVAAEAMAAGRAVIVTSECGIAPLVTEAGAGVVVPVSSAEIAQAIAATLADSSGRSRYGQAAASFAAARFSGDAIARRMLELYERAGSTRG